MKFAIMSDVHSNLYALEAVLKDISNRGVDNIYCTGDLVGYGPRPNEVIELIKISQIPTVMGNYDDAIGNMRFICGCDYKDEKSLLLGEQSIAWTKENTSNVNRKWLSELPGELRLSVADYKILLVHGSPRAMNEYLHEGTDEGYLNDLLSENKANILICGHTHIPYIKKLSNGYIINTGSVGKPKHGKPNSTYVIVEISSSDGIKAEILEVAYNYEKTAEEIEKCGLPTDFAEAIRNGGSDKRAFIYR
ncbi:MAG: metallophosphoesterase family protein [Desulfitobacterium hafniense]|nr:metallophosphoesterase family protein [Desulfitobacterium hafniense]